MAYVINPEKCEACGACAEACPVGIIEKNKETGKFFIDPDECLDCGTCQGECKHEAIDQE